MLNKYLQILSESLDKKYKILSDIEEKSREQAKLIEEEASFELIDKNMDEKAELIEQINKLDEGFQAMYDNIKANIKAEKEKYKSEIAEVQKKITLVMEKSATIEAIENRNKAAMEKRFSLAHKNNRQRVNQASVARGYYDVVNKLNAVTPQFMDSKK